MNIGAQHPENVLGIMHLSPSRQTFLNASVLDIVTDGKDGSLLILLEQWSLILMSCMPMFVCPCMPICTKDAETERKDRTESKLSGVEKGGGG